MTRSAIRALILSSVLSVSAHALDFGKRFAIGGGLGHVYPYKNQLFKDTYKEDYVWSANMKFGLGTDVLSLETSYTHIRLENPLTEDKLLLQPFVMSLRIHPFTRSRLSPYLILGGGVSYNQFIDAALPATTAPLRWSKFAGQAGVGFELFLNGCTSIGAQGLYHHLTSLPDDSPMRLTSVTGTLNIYFGEDPAARQAREYFLQESARMKEKMESMEAEVQEFKDSAAREKSEKEKAQQLANERLSRMNEAQSALDRLKKMMERKDISPIKFMSGKTELDPSSFHTLDLVASVIRKYADLGLRVEGHTDSRGKAETNLRLSQERADAVKKYLIYKGVSSSQIQSVGFGEARPIADNTTETGRAQNRRVEFFFFVP